MSSRSSILFKLSIQQHQAKYYRKCRQHRLGKRVTFLKSQRCSWFLLYRTELSWNDISKQRERGQHLFDTIYERHSKKVQDNMYTAYPDLGQAAIHQLYGPVLAESSVISAKETSLIMVAGLMLQDVPAQLKGHRYGALHHGATQQDLERLEIMVDIIARHYKV